MTFALSIERATLADATEPSRQINYRACMSEVLERPILNSESISRTSAAGRNQLDGCAFSLDVERFDVERWASGF